MRVAIVMEFSKFREALFVFIIALDFVKPPKNEVKRERKKMKKAKKGAIHESSSDDISSDKD